MNKETKQAIKFFLFSISAGVVQTLSFALLNDVLKVGNYWMAYLPSLVLSVIWNFTFNRKYTFKPTGHVGRDMLLVALYYAVFTPVTTLLGSWLESLGWHDWLIQALNMALNLVTEFLFQKYVVYREGKADGE